MDLACTAFYISLDKPDISSRTFPCDFFIGSEYPVVL